MSESPVWALQRRARRRWAKMPPAEALADLAKGLEAYERRGALAMPQWFAAMTIHNALASVRGFGPAAVDRACAAAVPRALYWPDAQRIGDLTPGERDALALWCEERARKLAARERA